MAKLQIDGETIAELPEGVSELFKSMPELTLINVEVLPDEASPIYSGYNAGRAIGWQGSQTNVVITLQTAKSPDVYLSRGRKK